MGPLSTVTAIDPDAARAGLATDHADGGADRRLFRGRRVPDQHPRYTFTVEPTNSTAIVGVDPLFVHDAGIAESAVTATALAR